jgi:hypothetical protein
MCDCSLKAEMSRLVGVGFVRCFVIRSLKVQLLLRCTLFDWLGHVFCMTHIIYRRGVTLKNRYRDFLSISDIRRKISCIICKSEKQILDG